MSADFVSLRQTPYSDLVPSPQNSKALDSPIYVHTFGSVSISYGDAILRDTDNRMKQLWNMILYLIVHRDREVTQEELISVLWTKKASDNPVNALKNLVYRVRKLFAQKDFPFARDVLVFDRGTYRWNNELPWCVDWENFAYWNKKAMSLPEDSPRRLGALLRCCSIYQGHFLERFSRELWLSALSTQWKNTYAQNVEEICAMLLRRQRYDKLLPVMQQAAALMPYTESIQKGYIRTLIAVGKQNLALRQYQTVLDNLYRHLGVRPSAEFYDLYRLITEVPLLQELDLDNIILELSDGDNQGGFYCEYSVFRQMYRQLIRTLPRSGSSAVLVLFTVIPLESLSTDRKHRNKCMEVLFTSIRSNVRMGDALCRVSPTQYLTLFPYADISNAQGIVNRIMRYFKRAFRNPNFHVKATMRSAEPFTQSKPFCRRLPRDIDSDSL